MLPPAGCYNGRPVFHPDAADDQQSWLIGGFCRDFQQIGIFPGFLGLDKIDPVLSQIALTLPLVKLECKNGMKNISLLRSWQAGWIWTPALEFRKTISGAGASLMLPERCRENVVCPIYFINIQYVIIDCSTGRKAVYIFYTLGRGVV